MECLVDRESSLALLNEGMDLQGGVAQTLITKVSLQQLLDVR
jgi:hypothetical protein